MCLRVKKTRVSVDESSSQGAWVKRHYAANNGKVEPFFFVFFSQGLWR